MVYLEFQDRNDHSCLLMKLSRTILDSHRSLELQHQRSCHSFVAYRCDEEWPALCIRGRPRF